MVKPYETFSVSFPERTDKNMGTSSFSFFFTSAGMSTTPIFTSARDGLGNRCLKGPSLNWSDKKILRFFWYHSPQRYKMFPNMGPVDMWMISVSFFRSIGDAWLLIWPPYTTTDRPRSSVKNDVSMYMTKLLCKAVYTFDWAQSKKKMHPRNHRPKAYHIKVSPNLWS